MCRCVAAIIKYALYILNIIFVACGIMLIVLGSIMLSDIGNISDYDQAQVTQVIPITIVSFGSVIFIISFLGCCGAIRENKFCTSFYSVCMFILFCLQISLTIWIFVNYDEFLNTMSDLVTTAWKENDSANGFPMNSLQLSFQCCGVNSYQDYINENKQVPSSCCGMDSGVCSADVYTTKPGCQTQFVDFWATNMDIVAYTGIGIALVEAVTFTFACILVNNIRRHSHNI